PLVDREKQVIAVLGGRPNDDKYLRLTQDAANEIESARAQLARSQQQGGRCGAFSSASVGVSFGGGQQVSRLSIPSASSAWLVLPTAREFLIIYPTFNSPQNEGLFRAWNPAVHTLYVYILDALTTANSDLRRNFELRLSAFAATTINFGPSTVTLPHIDALNLAWGWCAITALGFFDPDLGGHLVLWDLRLIIRFPPGSTILIPSAILRHSNISIRSNERRYSFTQYSAAGLFRWVDNGLRSDRTVEEEIQGNPEAQAERAEARRTQWAAGINTFRRWTDSRTL
ncbi:hypothetical protein DFH08DRAFT_710686, partial [Mycena albidolilacea]